MVSYQTYPIVKLGDDIHICQGNSTILSTSYSGALYTWSTGETTQSIEVNSTENYWLIVDINHCSDSDTIFVKVNSLPEFELGKDSTICQSEEIVISPNVYADFFIWTPIQSNASSVTISQAGTYTVTAIDSNGCAYTDSITFKDSCQTVLYVPSCFTPNGDGINDVFFAKGNNVYSFTLEIYNSWGNMIFFTNNIFSSWDGTLNGNNVIDDVYLWKIKYTEDGDNENGLQKEKMGRVVLYR